MSSTIHPLSVGRPSGGEPLVDDAAGRGPFGLPSMGISDWLAVVIGALIPIAYLPTLVGPTLTPRLALALVAAPAGAVTLLSLVRRRDAPAVLAVVFLAAAVVASLLGGSPIPSLKGTVLSHTSVLAYIAAIGCWALGRSITDDARAILGPVIVIATSVNIVAGLAQLTFQVYSGPLGTLEGRASGLMGNPAYYSSGLAAPCVYAMARAANAPRSRSWLSAVVVFAFGAGISGARALVGIIVLVVAVTLIVTWFRAWRVAAAVAVGLFAASVFTGLSAGTTTAGRFASKGGDGRLQVWVYDLRALLDRPLLGWGPGNHGVAVRRYFTAGFTRQYAYDDALIAWNEPHNLVMQTLVSTGVIGFLALAAFLVVQVRRDADWPLLAGFLAAAATWLLQPATVHSVPIAMLMLGAAARRRPGLVRGAAQRASLAVGLAFAALLIVPNALTTRAIRSGDLDAAATLAPWMGPDFQIANDLANKYTSLASNDPAKAPRAVEWSLRTLEIDDRQPYFWVQHARRMIALGRDADVLPAIERAIELERWNPSAWQLKLSYAGSTQNYELADEARPVVCELELELCVAKNGGRDGEEAGDPTAD